MKVFILAMFCLLALVNASSKKQLTEKEYVLVTGSANDNDKMEVIDKKGKTTVCPSKTFPEKVSSATGGVLEEHILICGGGFPATKECYIMGKETSWTKHTDMNQKRAVASSTVINDYLWVTGGFDENFNLLKTTEKIYSNGTVEPGINLPFPVRAHCMVNHGNIVYMLGGWGEGGDGNTKDVLIFVPEEGVTHSVGKPMSRYRSYFTCGLFYSKVHSNRPIMVAAGNGGPFAEGRKTGEFWDFTNPLATWQPTGDFPVNVGDGSRMTTTQNGDGVLLSHGKDMFKLDCTSTTSCLWKKEQNSLKISRLSHLMFTVPSNFLEKCNN